MKVVKKIVFSFCLAYGQLLRSPIGIVVVGVLGIIGAIVLPRNVQNEIGLTSAIIVIFVLVFHMFCITLELKSRDSKKKSN